MGCDAKEDAGALSLKYGPDLGLGALNYKRVTPPTAPAPTPMAARRGKGDI